MSWPTALSWLAVVGAAIAAAACAPPAHGPSPAAADDDSTTFEQAEDVVDYTMHASLDVPAHAVHATATIVWRNTSDVAIGELYFHLYLNAFKNERSRFMRDPISSGRGTGRVADWGHIDVTKLVARELGNVDLWPGADTTSPGDADDQTDIRVPLPRPIAPSESLTLDVAWNAKLPSIVERTGYHGSFHMVAQWFPKIARLEKDGTFAHFALYHLSEFYADFGRYDVTIDVPDGFTIGATGTRVSRERTAGRSIERYAQAGVHDFAWTAWDGFLEKTADAGGVALRCLYPRGYGGVADRHIAAVRFGLSYFGSLYGRYPYPTLTIVQPPRGAEEAAGMEYPTLITTNGAWYEPPFVHGSESVTLHELGHQWFYGLVATNEARWPFLDEGLTSYIEAGGLAAMFGPGSGLDVLGVRVGVGEILRLGALQAGHDEPVAQPASAFSNGSSYGSLAYGRAATILDTLAGVYGQGELVGALGRYARRHRFGHPDAEDLITSIREGLGDDAARNFRVALFERGWVDYVASEAVSHPEPAGNGRWRGWALVMRHGTLHLPVDVDLASADGTTTRVHWDGAGDFVRLPYEGKSELSRVVVDPSANVKLDENLLNNAWRAGARGVPRRALERAAYWAEVGLSMVMP